MPGLAGDDRWQDLRPAALEAVWESCREAFDVTVVDVGFCLEDDDEGSGLGRRRNAAAVGAICIADHVVAVADASGAGAARLADRWPQLTRLAGSTPVTLVCNRAGGSTRAWAEAVRACGVGAAIVSVPSDPRALQSCWRRGRSLGEGARRSRIRRALAAVATEVVPP
jgi:Flp pilus assembly CpaE family ATPase